MIYPTNPTNSHRAAGAVVSFLTTCQLTINVVCGVLGVKGFQVVPKRWIVERTFEWRAFHRRPAKDYEIKESYAEAVIY